MGTVFTELIAHLPGDAERRVLATRERAGPVLRDALRSECRLVLRTPEDAQAGRAAAHVPVAVVPALPVSLQRLDIPDDLHALMLLNLYRAPLRQVRDGTLHPQALPRMLAKLDAPPAWMPPDLAMPLASGRRTCWISWTNRNLSRRCSASTRTCWAGIASGAMRSRQRTTASPTPPASNSTK